VEHLLVRILKIGINSITDHDLHSTVFCLFQTTVHVSQLNVDRVHKNAVHLIFGRIFCECRTIFKIFLLTDSQENSLSTSRRELHRTWTVITLPCGIWKFKIAMFQERHICLFIISSSNS